MLRVKVNHGLCVGAGLCVLSTNEVFDQGEEDGLVVLLQAQPPEELRKKVLSAARTCPSLAIKVEEDPDGESPA